MIKKNPQHFLLYLMGIILLIFGNRQFWEKIRAEEEKKEQDSKRLEMAAVESLKKFEVQKLAFDQVKKKWNNKHVSFQIIHLDGISFERANSPKAGIIKVETNDDENASDSL